MAAANSTFAAACTPSSPIERFSAFQSSDKKSVFVNVFGNYWRTICRKRFLKVQILTESGMSRKITDIRQGISNRLRDAF
jgi:hypothetical protein